MPQTKNSIKTNAAWCVLYLKTIVLLVLEHADVVEVSPFLVERVGEARLPEVVDFDGEFLLMHGT